MNNGSRLWLQQFGALVRKRGLSVRRDRKAWASQLLLPTLFVAVALLIATLLQVKTEEPPIKVSMDMFVGTTNAGSTTQSLEKYDVPFTHFGHGADIAAAFTKAAGTKGALDVIRVDKPTGMDDYLLAGAKKKELSGCYGAVSVDNRPGAANATLWFKNQGIHAIPAMMNFWNNARMNLIGFADTSTEVWSHPLPKTEQLLEEEMTGSSQMVTDLTVAITVIIAMGFVPASFVVYLVHEKSTNGKHQQLLTGVNPTMYWVTSYCWDMINYLFPLVLCMALFCFSAAYGGANAPAMFLLLLFYGACMTPCMYCVEPSFSVASTAYVTLICLNIFTGTVSTMAVAVMDSLQNEIDDLKPVNDFCKAVFPWILPNYNLGRGMIQIAVNHYINYAAEQFGLCDVLDQHGRPCSTDPLSWDVSGRSIASLAFMAPVWLMLRLLIEWGFCLRGPMRRCQRSDTSADIAANVNDVEVSKEVCRVNESMNAAKASGSISADALVIENLTKTFKKVRAVRGVSVGIPAGECFGLLGVNGAGKTTTMRMITGDVEVGGGDVLVGGWSVRSHRDRARRRLGYCPQFDALPDKLTVRETLALYARIRGVPSKLVKDTVESLLARMCLEAHQNSRCEHLSGGNKRKLSTAMALIGEPDVVLLDEPSTGVDVGARRFLWDVISSIRHGGRAIVLTSHSMEECEVLCTRLTIMVHGQMRCLGSPVQLKDKYGGGYTLTIKTELAFQDSDPSATVQKFIEEKLPMASLAETSVGMLRFRFGGRDSKPVGESADGNGDNSANAPLANIFKLFEEATAEGGEMHGVATDYSISQTSLEEVFLHFSQEADGQKFCAPSA